MDAIPFGISRLDTIIEGGAPPGSVVLLVGEPGAGAREFLYTSAAMNAIYHGDDELFDLHYGSLHPSASVPPDIHYLSFTDNRDAIEEELAYTLDEEIVDAAVDEMSFRDFSPEYFQLSPVPREWYMGETQSISDLADRGETASVLTALGEYLNQHAAGSLVCIDSITDLVGSITDDMSWTDITTLMKGIAKAAHEWQGLILLLASQETLSDVELGHMMEAAGGTLRFEWTSGGSVRSRTMVVEEFRGVLSRIEEEDIVRFETEIHEGGFDVSDVRKIR